MKNTKERILNAAEKLFAEHGFDAASLRSITAEAGVNLAAVNYHFNSKDALIQAIFARRFALLNQQRQEMLQAYKAEAGDKPMPLEKLMRALIEPAFRMPLDSTASVTELGKLIGRIYSTDSPAQREIIAAEVRTRLSQFHESMRAALPGIPAEEYMWRIFFSIGAMIHTLAASKNLEFISDGLCKASDTEKVLEKLISYVVEGMRAPLPYSIRQGGKRQVGSSKIPVRTNGKTVRLKSHAASQGRKNL
jgi:AcrR family transcriptional regulator